MLWWIAGYVVCGWATVAVVERASGGSDGGLAGPLFGFLAWPLLWAVAAGLAVGLALVALMAAPFWLAEQLGGASRRRARIR